MDILRKITLGGDARSTRGTFARGKPVYRAGSNAPNLGPNIKKPFLTIQEAARRRVAQKHGNGRTS